MNQADAIDTSLQATPQATPQAVDVVIVGAGLSGLVAARTLVDAGRSVVVLDKGRRAGGRMATKRLTQQAVVDHGAQFFTVRSTVFNTLVEGWVADGVAVEWCRGFTPAGDGYPRYRGVAGMNGIARHLATGLPIVPETTVQRIHTNHNRFILSSSDNRSWSSRTVLLGAPVPQSLALLDAGGIELPGSFRDALNTVTYARCLALMVELDGEPAVPEPGGVQLGSDDDPMFSFVADNRRKGISEQPTLTLHVHDEPSMRLWDVPREEVAIELVAAARRWIGDARVVQSQVHGWRYARPIVGLTEASVWCELPNGGRLGFMGDAFGGAKVEGAVLSGLDSAHRVFEDS
jgi:renalase